MRTMNQVTLIGRIGRDPELRAAANGGLPWATFTIATNRGKRGEGDAWIEETDWHRVKVFGRNAEYVEKYVKKGALVSLEGSIQYSSWTAQDGVKRYGTTIIGERVSMLVAARVDSARAETTSDEPAVESESDAVAEA